MDATARFSPLAPLLRALFSRRPMPDCHHDQQSERAFLMEMIHRNPEGYASDLDLLGCEGRH